MSAMHRMTPLALLVLQAIAAGAYAQEATGNSDQPVQITIFGQGQTRQVQNVTRDDLSKALPGTSPLKTLEKLPGVSFESADPFGSYEWSTRFSVRGFSQNQMGFTLDGVPLGDMSYGNNNGLHISRAISSENVGRVTISQGAGAVGTASTSNLGGTVQFFSSDPTDTMSVTGAQTIGSNSTYRTFARYDTGLLDSGTKAYISLTRSRSQKWKGDGPQDQDLLNTKLVQKFGDNKLTVFYNYSDRKEIDYQDMSLDMLNRLGWDWDNYAPDWQRAVSAANGVFTGGVNNLDDAYYQGSGLRKDHLAGATLDAHLSASTVLKTTIYHHGNNGQGHWYTPYQASSATMPISIRTTEYSIERDGVIADLTWDWGVHSVNGGFWAERSNHTLTRNFYAISGPQDMNYFLSNPFKTAFKQDFSTTTTQFYLQDTMGLMNDSLKLNFGFKTPKVSINTTNEVGTRAAGSLTARKDFLPQIGVSYDLTKRDEIFASAAQNMRAYQPGVNGPFSQTQAAFDQSSSNLKPETSTTFDFGYRFHGREMGGSVTLYHVDFNDRLVSVATCAGIVGCPSTFINVGKVTTNGIEAAASWNVVKNWTLFGSYTYNNSKYASNYYDAATVVAVDGKQVVDSPKNMFNGEVSYDDGSWFARTDAKYTDKRYYTYLNDASVPSYWLFNASAGYKAKTWGAFKDVTIQLNIDNLFNKRYFGTIGSNGFFEKDPQGVQATLLTGAPRQLFLTVSAKL